MPDSPGQRYLKDEIFLPLGMKDTVFHPNEEQKRKLVTEYVYHEDTDSLSTRDNLFTEYRLSPNYDSGGAGLYSTTEDYEKLADAIACGGTGWNGYEVLQSETVALYAQNRLDDRLQKEFEQKAGHAGQGYGRPKM